jgi:hypothetical protein
MNVLLVLFLQKKNTSSFSEEKEAKRLLFLGKWRFRVALPLGGGGWRLASVYARLGHVSS